MPNSNVLGESGRRPTQRIEVGRRDFAAEIFQGPRRGDTIGGCSQVNDAAERHGVDRAKAITSCIECREKNWRVEMRGKKGRPTGVAPAAGRAGHTTNPWSAYSRRLYHFKASANLANSLFAADSFADVAKRPLSLPGASCMSPTRATQAAAAELDSSAT